MKTIRLLALSCVDASLSVAASGQPWEALPEKAPAPADNPTTPEGRAGVFPEIPDLQR